MLITKLRKRSVQLQVYVQDILWMNCSFIPYSLLQQGQCESMNWKSVPVWWHPICGTQRGASFSRYLPWRGTDWQCQSPNGGAKRHVGRQSVDFPLGSLFFPRKHNWAWWSPSRKTGIKKYICVSLLVLNLKHRFLWFQTLRLCCSSEYQTKSFST